MDFTELDEGKKPFPSDKVGKKIDQTISGAEWWKNLSKLSPGGPGQGSFGQTTSDKSKKLTKRARKMQDVSTKNMNSESMNYSEFCKQLDDTTSPLYKVEGKLPQCPPGYVWSRQRKDCIPKTDKDKISGKLSDNKDDKPQNQYNVWGRTGLNGDGYAYEEPFVNRTDGFSE